RHGSPRAPKGTAAMTAHDLRLARVALSCLAEPGNRELGQLVRRVGPIEGLDRLVSGAVSQRLGETAQLRLTGGTRGRGRDGTGSPGSTDSADAGRLAEALLATAGRLGARAVTPEDEEWPRQLDDLVHISRANDGRAVERDTDPPHCLWVR